MNDNTGQTSAIWNLVFFAAQSGDVERIKAILEGKSQAEVERIINSKMGAWNPLIAACYRGHLDVASYLIEHCQADVDVWTYHLGTLCKAYSPLLCAAREGHLELVKLLVKCKADINGASAIGETPLGIACERNYLEIVKYLIGHGADTEIYVGRETCLMRACRLGNYDVVKCLLDCGADVNVGYSNGRTALHVCAQDDHLNILKLLLESGAENVTDCHGITPLLEAANECQLESINYLLRSTNTLKITKQDKVNALELLGAACLENVHLLIGWALKYWREAMKLRYEDDKCPLPKPASRSLLGITEANSFAELEALSSNREAMRIQGLLVRGRIVPQLDETIHLIHMEGKSYKLRGNYDKCMELWLYALNIRQKQPPPFSNQLLLIISNFEEIFSFTRDDDTERILATISFDSALKVFKAVVTEAENQFFFFHKSHENIEIFFEFSLLTEIAFRIMSSICSLKPRFGEKFIESEFKSAVYHLVHTEPRGKCGFEVLKMAVNFFSYSGIEFGSVQEELIDLLLEMGADPNECDEMNNTALHMAVKGCNISLFELLLSRGAHLDISNHCGETPLELAQRNSNFELNLNPLKYLNLQCLSARSVRMNNIPYEGLVDKNLKTFLDQHEVCPD